MCKLLLVEFAFDCFLREVGSLSFGLSRTREQHPIPTLAVSPLLSYPTTVICMPEDIALPMAR